MYILLNCMDDLFVSNVFDFGSIFDVFGVDVDFYGCFVCLCEWIDELEMFIFGLFVFVLLVVLGCIFDVWVVSEVYIDGIYW